MQNALTSPTMYMFIPILQGKMPHKVCISPPPHPLPNAGTHYSGDVILSWMLRPMPALLQ